MISAIDETRKRWSAPATYVAAIQPANASAAWPDGHAAAQRRATARVGLGRDHDDHRQHERDERQLGRRLAQAVEQVRRAVGDLAREDEVADGDRVDRRDQHRAGGDVLGELRHRVERRRRDVDRRLRRRVFSISAISTNVIEISSAISSSFVTFTTSAKMSTTTRDREMDAHVSLRAEHVDDPLERVVEGVEDAPDAAPSRGSSRAAPLRALPSRHRGRSRAGAAGRG